MITGLLLTSLLALTIWRPRAALSVFPISIRTGYCASAAIIPTPRR